MDNPTNDGPADRPSNRQRQILSCLTCRRRKVGCDHKQPICTACERGGHDCEYTPGTHANAHSVQSGRVRKSTSSDATKQKDNPKQIEARMEKVETLLHIIMGATGSPQCRTTPSEAIGPSLFTTGSQSRNRSISTNGSSSLDGYSSTGNLTNDGGEGTLLVENGQSRFVSAMHWSLLAGEVSSSTPGAISP
jgi:hypothetical protein